MIKLRIAGWIIMIPGVLLIMYQWHDWSKFGWYCKIMSLFVVCYGFTYLLEYHWWRRQQKADT